MYRETEILQEATADNHGQMVINVGPQHPATHGVLHLKITLEGETIVKIEPNLGYIHRSIEKMCESLSYRQFIYVTSRMDYLSAHINNHACALCVEQGLQVEIPRRAQVIRVLMDELPALHRTNCGGAPWLWTSVPSPPSFMPSANGKASTILWKKPAAPALP